MEVPGQPQADTAADLTPILLEPAPPLAVKFYSFGDYELLEELARGGMGVVFRARQVSLNRILALKFVLPGRLNSREAVRRFRREAEAAASLDHPDIIPIYEVGEHQGHLFFSMKLVEGGTLAHWKKMVAPAEKQEVATPPREGMAPLDPAAKRGSPRATFNLRHAVLVVSRIARAVYYAHQHGILHRDLKPSNILLDTQGQPYLTDFGLAKVLAADGQLTETKDLLGTPGYMAPEQAKGEEATPAADIYSLGAILYELLTGRPPYQGKTLLDTLRQVQQEDPPSPATLNPRVDRDLCSICLACLEKEPRRRYPSALALAEDLERWLRGETVMVRRASLPDRLARWVRRNPAGTLTILVLFLSLGISLILLAKISDEQAGKKNALNILLKAIFRNVEQLAEPPQRYCHLTAEELRALSTQQAKRTAVDLRFTVGTFVQENLTETTITFARILPFLEAVLSKEMRLGVRLDLRIYRDPSAAVDDFASGQVALMRMDPKCFVEARQSNSGAVALLRENATPISTLIITRPDSGITNLLGLRNRTLAFWDRDSMFTFTAKVRLLAAGLNSSDLTCLYLDEGAGLASAAPKVFIQQSEESYYDRTGATVMALTNRQCDASVCVDWQLEKLQKGTDWVLVATAETERHLWAAGSQLSADCRAVFQKALRALPSELYGLLIVAPPNNELDLQEVNDGFIQWIDTALEQETEFDRCRPVEASPPAGASELSHPIGGDFYETVP